MNKNNTALFDFIENFKELQNSIKEAYFDNSFDKEQVTKNIHFIKQNRFAITDDIWMVDQEQNHHFISAFFEILESHENELTADINYLKNMFLNDVQFSTQFTLNALQNNFKLIYDFARNNQISTDFISFISIFLAFPYREAVAHFIKTNIDLKDHISGFCPVCGHWPGISYIQENDGKRIMACICCGTFWSFRRLKCPFCKTTEKNALGYLNIEGDDTNAAYTCDICRRYLKTIRIKGNHNHADHWAIVDYMLTADLDIAASQNKYLQEQILNTRFQGPEDPHLEIYLNKISGQINK